MNLDLEILRRNARLRAHRANGVPVEGGWEKYVADDVEGNLTYFGFLKLRCSACRENCWYSPSGDQTFVEAEQFAVGRLVRPPPNAKHRPCPHLAPLLLPDPPEVEAITELELLAGAP